jgi:sphinganine-1-phosphate aldolase
MSLSYTGSFNPIKYLFFECDSIYDVTVYHIAYLIILITTIYHMINRILPTVLYICYRSFFDLNEDNHSIVSIKKLMFNFLKKLSYFSSYIELKQAKKIDKFKADLVKDRFAHVTVDLTDSILQDEGIDKDVIKAKVDKINMPNCTTFKVSGLIYTDLTSLNNNNDKCFGKLFDALDLKSLWLNPTHNEIWPNLVQVEAELYNMCSDLFHAKSSNCMLTSGGTMSNIEAVYTYRTIYSNITNPNIVAPVTAHTSFKKACQILKIQYRLCKVDENGKANVQHMERLIDCNTILLVASCPSFPYGIIDPINEISILCKKYNKFLHIDACLGGFLLPFIDDAVTRDLNEVFDFRNPFITSISADLHKFGKMPKGLSILMFKSYDIKKYLTFVDLNWVGGLYVMPDFPGSRSGFLILMAWCMMKMIGKNAYKETTKQLIDTKTKLIDRMKSDLKDDVYVVGDPKLSVFGFRSKKHNIHFIGDLMHKKYGWTFNSLPDGMHFCITENNVRDEKSSDEFVNTFIRDLTTCVRYAESHSNEAANSSSHKMYCSTQSIPNYVDGASEEVGRMYIAVQNMVKKQ